MSSSFEKSVKGGTKIKLAPPKSKYVEHILVATHAGEAGVAEIFRALQNRLRDSTWTVVFKSLIIIHLMIREGEPDVTLSYLSSSPSRKLAISNFTEVQTQGRNIRTYTEYLLERAKAFGGTKVDYVRGGEGRLKRLTIDKGLLRETEAVQGQIKALVKCELLSNEPENEITLVAFRLLTMDLLVLFHIMNEGTINVLEHYFEMSHPDAQRALNIYRTFCKQTELVVQYLSVARMHEHSTRLEIPKIKHAPTSLAKSLEEYLNAPDFDTSRRQYLAAKDAKRNNKGSNGSGEALSTSRTTQASKGETRHSPAPQPSGQVAARADPKPAPDLIDFFESIDLNQQPLAQQPGPQPYQQQLPYQHQQQQQPPMQQGGFTSSRAAMPQQSFPTGATQPSNPYGQSQQPQQIQPNFTGAGFGGYTPQPQQAFSPQASALGSIPQNGMPDFSVPQQTQQMPPQQQQQQFQGAGPTAAPLQPQSTNPFRMSMMPSQTGGLNAPPVPTNNTSQLNRSPTNPFARNTSPAQQQVPNMPPQPFVGNSSFQASQPPAFQQQQPPPQALQPTPTGTNPFARQPSPNQVTSPIPAPQGGLMPNPTGTNPFRQSMFVNQQTGQGWQSGPQGTMGGLENLETVPVFPRPGQQQQQPQQGGW